MVFDLNSDRASVWATLFTGAFAAFLICVASLLPQRRLGAGRRWPLVVFGSVLVVAVVATLPMAVNPGLLPHDVTASLPAGVAHPTVNAFQVTLALLYILAAYGFARRSRLTADELSGWLAIACILAGASRINYYFHPSIHADWVYTADVFRLGFYLALLSAPHARSRPTGRASSRPRRSRSGAVSHATYTTGSPRRSRSSPGMSGSCVTRAQSPSSSSGSSAVSHERRMNPAA